MLRRLALALALIGLANAPTAKALAVQVSTQPFVIAQAALPAVFSSEDEAQQHCPRDVVVWLNIPSGIYHYKGERWYGRTKHGAYACEKEAIKAGDRASENGQ